MTGKQLRTMSIAVNYNRIGFVYLVGSQPMDWQMSFKATNTSGNVHKKIRQWIDFYGPDVVITEAGETLDRKGERTLGILGAVKRAVDKSDVQHIEQPRIQPYRNRYLQIDELSERYPQMKAIAPKRRRFYEKEPAYVTIFDALAMADAIYRQ